MSNNSVETTLTPRDSSYDEGLNDGSSQDNPATVLTAWDIVRIRRSYSLSPSVVLKLPSRHERVTNARLDEIVVYETTFVLGLRDMIPFLVAKIAATFSISPGQFSLLAWRTLIAIQAFGEFHSLDIGVDEVLFAYYFLPLKADFGRYTIHSRHHSPLVFNLPLSHKRKLKKTWRQEYLFMRVGYNLGFPTTWFRTDVRSKGRVEGKPIVSQVLSYAA